MNTAADRARAAAVLLVVVALALVAARSPDGGEPARSPDGGAAPSPDGGEDLSQDLTPTDPEREPSLSVPRLRSLVTDDEPLRLHVRVANNSPTDRNDLRVVTTLHSSVTTRFALHESLDNEPTTGVVHAITRELPTVPARGARTVALRQTQEELGLPATGTSATVHPVRIALQSEGEVIDETLTAAVVAGRDAIEPLRVALLLPLTGPPAELPEGRLDIAAARKLVDPQQAVPSLLQALEQHPRAPVTLATDGLALVTLERLQAGADLVSGGGTPRQGHPDGPVATAATRVLDRLVEVAGQPEVDQIPLPYGRADLAALVRHGAAEEATRHVGDGTDDIERLTGQRPQARTLWPAAGINAPALRRLRGAAETVVLSQADVISDPARLTPPPVRRLQADQAGTLRALVPDPWIEQSLTDIEPGGGAVRAARLIAEVATVHLEQPGVADRGLLIAPPPDTPTPGSVIEPLLSALDTATFAELADLAEIRDTGADGEVPDATLDYPATARFAELSSAYIAALREARQHVGSLDALLAPSRELVGRLDRRLLQAASTAYRDRPQDGLALIDGIGDLLTDLQGSVSLPETPPVTLAAEEGTLPVRLTSTADVPLQVKVTLRTAAYEVQGGPTHEVELAPDQDQLLSFDVRSLAPGGTSPVQVIVTDPDEITELATGTVVVRSTDFSVTGVVVTAGAALFLLVALWRQVTRRRGPARPEASSESRARAGAGR